MLSSLIPIYCGGLRALRRKKHFSVVAWNTYCSTFPLCLGLKKINKKYSNRNNNLTGHPKFGLNIPRVIGLYAGRTWNCESSKRHHLWDHTRILAAGSAHSALTHGLCWIYTVCSCWWWSMGSMELFSHGYQVLCCFLRKRFPLCHSAHGSFLSMARLTGSIYQCSASHVPFPTGLKLLPSMFFPRQSILSLWDQNTFLSWIIY